MPHSEGISSNCTPAMRVMNKKSGGKQLTQQSYDLVTVLLFAILFFFTLPCCYRLESNAVMVSPDTSVKPRASVLA